jgi:hypothetical protein
MDRSNRLKFILSCSLVIFLLVSTIIFSRGDNVDSDLDVKGESDRYFVPRIVSVAPISVLEGREYIYDVKVADSDSSSSDISIDIVEGPAWLSIDDNVVSGVARGIGTYKVVLRVTDGENFSLQENYILVDKGNE